MRPPCGIKKDKITYEWSRVIHPSIITHKSLVEGQSLCTTGIGSRNEGIPDEGGSLVLTWVGVDEQQRSANVLKGSVHDEAREITLRGQQNFIFSTRSNDKVCIQGPARRWLRGMSLRFYLRRYYRCQDGFNSTEITDTEDVLT